VIALLHVAALIGATLILVRGTIFRWLQRLYPPLFGCCQCTGTWVGFAAGASGIVSAGHGRLIDALVVGAATSVLALAADALLLTLLGDPDEEEKS
jgi:hypothetical protein